MRLKKNLSILIISLILLVGIVSASFGIGNLSHSIDKQYGPFDSIKGWINISLNNEPSNSLFEDSGENTISLIDLLKKNTGLSYNCSIANCVSDYSADNPELTKTFSLNFGEEKIIGFKFNEKLKSVNSVKFTVESDAPSSCYNQLKIDFLNDDKFEIGNNKSGSGCSFLKNDGCFEDNVTTKQYKVGYFPNKHCQRVKLQESPKFKLGAWIKDAKNLKMALYTLNGQEITACSLTDSVGTEGEKSCNVDYFVIEQKEYYVCIYSNAENPISEIKGYSTSNGCGFYGTGIKNETGSFNIFAEGLGFGGIGTLNITNSLSGGSTISQLFSDYIKANYGGFDCSGECVVPIRFMSGEDQTITIKNLEISYESELGGVNIKNFSDLNETTATINSNFIKIILNSGNFSAPSSYGNKTFDLSLNRQKIFSEKISIENVPVISSVNPTKTASAYPTEFTLDVNASLNITKYGWDFGDSKTETTTKNKATHTYNSTGKYQMKITATDSGQRTSSKTFNITVESPKEIINSTLKDMQSDLENVKWQIKNYSSFSTELNRVLDIENIDGEIGQLQREFSRATSEEEYNKIMPKLLALNVPKSLSKTKSADSILFYSEKENINLDVLNEIGGEDNYSDEKAIYVDAIMDWQLLNIETKTTFNEFSAVYGTSEKPVLKTFELKISDKGDSGDYYYLIVKKLENMTFKENYMEGEKLGYYYIQIKQPEKTIAFSTTEDIGVDELPAFISPEINDLVLVDLNIPEPKEDKSKWTIFIFVIVLLAIIGLVVYVILQQWYKRKYENYLFKNRNHLYNLLLYVENSRKSRVSDDVIESKLRKSGWNSEQIRYVTRKHAGKGTGMFEIPIRKIMEKFRKKEQQNPQAQKSIIFRNQGKPPGGF